MTNKQKAYENVNKWRGLSLGKRRSFLRVSAVKHVKTSMAMESEPVSDLWLKQNAR